MALSHFDDHSAIEEALSFPLRSAVSFLTSKVDSWVSGLRGFSLSQNISTAQATAGVSSSITAGSGRDYFDVLDELERVNLQEERSELLLEHLMHGDSLDDIEYIYRRICCLERSAETTLVKSNDTSQSAPSNPDRWLEPITIHRQLLRAYHDYFQAVQHPSGSEYWKVLTKKKKMPARAWTIGVQRFLEALFNQLPTTLEHMLNVFHTSHSTMILYHRTVPMFENIWMECLGDLARFGMVLHRDDRVQFNVWRGAGQLWYGRAADKSPESGRLLHHQGILAKSCSIPQLSFYCRALAAISPYEDAERSIMALFTPVLTGQPSSQIKNDTIDTLLIKCLAVLFKEQYTEEYTNYVRQIVEKGVLSRYIDRAGSAFKRTGVLVCLVVLSSLTEFPSTREPTKFSSIIRRAIDDARARQQTTHSTTMTNTPAEARSPVISTIIDEASGTKLTEDELESSSNSIMYACKITFGIFAVVLEKPENCNIMPMVHVYTAFLKTVASLEIVVKQLEAEIPWSLLVAYLNHYVIPQKLRRSALDSEFPKMPEDTIGRPLPEDFFMRGQIGFFDYFPPKWFEDADLVEEEKLIETPATADARLTRVLWNALRIAAQRKWIVYRSDVFKFEVTDYGLSLKPRKQSAPMC